MRSGKAPVMIFFVAASCARAPLDVHKASLPSCLGDGQTFRGLLLQAPEEHERRGKTFPPQP